MKTHRDGLPGLSARSVRRGDAGHREACATQGLGGAESPGKPPFRSDMRPVGGRRKVLTMHHFPPARRVAYAISLGFQQRSLV